MIELKPCPKCGAVPEYILTGDYNQSWVLVCPDCLYSVEKWGEGRSTKIGARLAWNRGVKKRKNE